MTGADEQVRQRAADNGLALTPERAALLAPFVAGLDAADARLAAHDLGVAPAAGPPWPLSPVARPAQRRPRRGLSSGGGAGQQRNADALLDSIGSIAELAARYRDGSASPVAVTEAVLARIDAHNPTLNAFITVTHAAARAAARQAEQELRQGYDRGPLHGVPLAIKDLVDTAGVRTTCGSRILADYVPAADAPVVAWLKAAGAVLVGKTNLLEFAYGIVHPDVGPTWNPWAPTRTAGARAAGRRRRWRRGCVLRLWAPTRAGRSGYRPPTVVWRG